MIAYPCGTEPRIAIRPTVGAAAGILQQQELQFKRLFIEGPVLILVEEGIKSLRWPGGACQIRAGEAIALAGGQAVDITNQIGASGSYRARWLAWDNSLIAAHANTHSQQTVIQNALPIIGAPAEFTTAFHQASAAMEADGVPMDIARHRAAELLLWIGAHGGRFEQTRDLTLTVKIRRVIGQDVSGEWSASTVASAFAISEATLRRRLADEGTSLSAILVDTRMTFALQLLQSTAQPVTQIALSVGYQTPSQFAVRFRDRFGFPPTSVRGHRRLSQ